MAPADGSHSRSERIREMIVRSTIYRYASEGAIVLVRLLSGGLIGCATMENANHYRVPAAQVEEMRVLIGAHKCPEGKSVVVAGGEFRVDGSLDLAVGCR